MENDTAAPALTPDMTSKLKKEDMKQAIVERFGGRTKPTDPRPATRTGKP